MLVHASFCQEYRKASEGPNESLDYPRPSSESYPYSAPGSGGVSPASTMSTGPPKLYKDIRMAHAVLSLLAFGLFFPLGSILIRTSSLRATTWLHACWQLFTLAMAASTVGIGIRMVYDPTQAANEFFSEPHTMIGIVTICLLLAVQPVTGILHHKSFRRHGSRTAFTYAHMLYGIPLITLGAINGGLGLKLSHEPLKYTVTYGVLSGTIWLWWMFATFNHHHKQQSPVLRKKTNNNESIKHGRIASQNSSRPGNQ